MTELIGLMEHEFVRNAVLAGILASILCAVVGTFVVVKRLVFVSGGVSHAAFGGIGVCHYLGAAPLVGAIGAAVACALVLGLAGSGRLRSQDAVIGVLWSAGMAVGIVFIQLTPGYAPDLMPLLFGDILATTSTQLSIAAAVSATVLLGVGLLFKEFVAVAFDEPFAAVQGVPVRPLLTLLLVMVAVSVVVLIQVVGIILVIALLAIPPLIGMQYARSFGGLVALSITIGLAITMLGLATSYSYDLPSGPAIVLLGTGLLCLSRVFQWLQGPPRTVRFDDSEAEELQDHGE